jgi:hypothetical protein
VAFWFLDYCISACCPIDRLPRIKTATRSMPPLPWPRKTFVRVGAKSAPGLLLLVLYPNLVSGIVFGDFNVVVSR